MDPREAETVELFKPPLAAEKYFCKPIDLALNSERPRTRGSAEPKIRTITSCARGRRCVQELLLTDLPTDELVLLGR